MAIPCCVLHVAYKVHHGEQDLYSAHDPHSSNTLTNCLLITAPAQAEQGRQYGGTHARGGGFAGRGSAAARGSFAEGGVPGSRPFMAAGGGMGGRPFKRMRPDAAAAAAAAAAHGEEGEEGGWQNEGGRWEVRLSCVSTSHALAH